MNEKALIVLGKTPVVEKVEGRENGVISGDPTTNVWKYFVHPSGQMNVGIWDCQAGQWENESHANNELCVIVEGEVNITDETGASYDLKPGDSFFLPFSPSRYEIHLECKNLCEKDFCGCLRSGR